MSQSLSKIWIHTIWATKSRQVLIIPDVENEVFENIQESFKEMGCSLVIINGMPDHIHCLFLLNPKRSLSEIIQFVKGNSSHFINQHNIIREKFSWQKGYSAFSVSESIYPKVYQYIKNQKKHHLNKEFDEEIDEFNAFHKINPE